MEQLDVIYEDNHIIVVIKPQNIPTMEDASKDLDLLSMVKAYIKEKYNKPGNVYVGLVHRLDRPTGGIMVFAKTSKAASRLSAQIQDGTMKKEYLTVLKGQLPLKTKKIVNYLKKDGESNTVKIVPMSEEGAKRAELIFEVLETDFSQNPPLTLAKIELLTGRSHQIRVQMAALKAPVFGDWKYGGETKKQNLALWAYKLEFVHPTTKQKMSFKVLPEAKLPWTRFNLSKI